MARRKKGIPGVSFSWKRATGISSAKQKIARTTGIPTTKQGRQRKAGKMLGCMLPMTIIIGLILVVFVLTILM